MSESTIERLPTVLHRLGVSRSSLYKLIQRGDFKAPVKLGPRSVGWLSTDTDDFIAARVHASRQQVSQ
ncbi:helix-turn-helix transcriptional regulator [Massilia soli]|uniref:AlpA family phage regulatory protein n=1 Tax=Massilia soli TaxID=2792854 RepID=A0ABS7SND8_9BURK|nr:AlpA family phage regulatory protein [Massilia soli]MBZ2207668.1 AlpA family phage regulatory protein [Massilia soli]